MCAIHLIEAPKKVFSSTIDIVAARVVREIIAQRGARKFEAEQINFVQEENNAGPHEPSRVDYRVEEH